jgi:Family of unknown function (DUF5337)
MPFDDRTERERRTARQSRRLALVIAATGLLWALAQPVLAALGASPRVAVLVDLVALAAFVWSMAVAWRIWSRRRK